MTPFDQTGPSLAHGRHASLGRPAKVSPIVWPIVAMVAMVPVLGYLLMALLT